MSDSRPKLPVETPGGPVTLGAVTIRSVKPRNKASMWVGIGYDRDVAMWISDEFPVLPEVGAEAEMSVEVRSFRGHAVCWVTAFGGAPTNRRHAVNTNSHADNISRIICAALGGGYESPMDIARDGVDLYCDTVEELEGRGA